MDKLAVFRNSLRFSIVKIVIVYKKHRILEFVKGYGRDTSTFQRCFTTSR